MSAEFAAFMLVWAIAFALIFHERPWYVHAGLGMVGALVWGLAR